VFVLHLGTVRGSSWAADISGCARLSSLGRHNELHGISPRETSSSQPYRGDYPERLLATRKSTQPQRSIPRPQKRPCTSTSSSPTYLSLQHIAKRFHKSNRRYTYTARPNYSQHPLPPRQSSLPFPPNTPFPPHTPQPLYTHFQPSFSLPLTPKDCQSSQRLPIEPKSAKSAKLYR
jgi:hypothetical protein